MGKQALTHEHKAGLAMRATQLVQCTLQMYSYQFLAFKKGARHLYIKIAFLVSNDSYPLRFVPVTSHYPLSFLIIYLFLIFLIIKKNEKQ